MAQAEGIAGWDLCSIPSLQGPELWAVTTWGTADAKITVLWFTCDPWAILRSAMICPKPVKAKYCLPALSSSFVRCVFSVSTCAVLRMVFHQVHLPPGKRGLPVGHLPGRASNILSQLIGQ